jgi:2-phosphoglycerate kinase
MWGIPALQVDDFRLVLERVVRQAQQTRAAGLDLWEPLGLRAIYETGEVFADSRSTPERMCQCLIDTGQVMSDAIEVVLAHHIGTKIPVIIEGDGILPSLAARRAVAGQPLEAGQLRAIFLVEMDEARLFESALRRGRGFEKHARSEQGRVIRASWLYGKYLQAEAQRLALPVLDSQPWHTLVTRAVSTLVQP